ANDEYAKANYSDAAEHYEAVIDEYGSSPEIYFNLGNCYYKLNETGKSILNYERALRLNPRYENAKINLQLARQRVVDNIIQPPPFFLRAWVNSLTAFLNSNQWLWTSVTLFVLCLAAFLFFIFGYNVALRKTMFYLAIALFCLSMTGAAFAAIRKNQTINHHDAIIMTGTVTVKSSPDKSGTDLFQLHEGTKVKVKSALGEWNEIVIGNGNVGWLENRAIEVI
ncbi:MAG: tetratricopeptide repeat protein, partial [Paludibacter sp.]|nr:tetratricopeptide repeat protein [Paludibacter sp.]